MNIFPLSCIANCCRGKSNQSNPITWKMQFILWFAGLRGAIAFALALNMPGPNAETYTTATLIICGITTVICGGGTEKMLGLFGMKETDSSMSQIAAEDGETNIDGSDEDEEQFGLFSSNNREFSNAYDGLKGLWSKFDYIYLRPHFGGSATAPALLTSSSDKNDSLGHYELGTIQDQEDEEESDGLFLQE